ncbi:MAG: bile acid:Na+ symporter, family [Bacteroidales bacterium]|nr:bile acid:Na+ symporter, family [Bacteroidales bacterium]
MKILYNIILNRNFILVFAVIMGMVLGDYAVYLKDYTIYVLAITMIFSTTGIDSKALLPIKKIFKPMLVGTLLNYFVFGAIVLVLAWLLMPTKELFMGFVVIVAAPPGVAVIPFTGILKGDIEYSILGVFGAFLASIAIAPALIELFAKNTDMSSWSLFMLMIKLVLVPLILSRLLLFKPVFKYVAKIRGKVVDWGFAIIIFTAVGMNRDVFFSNPVVLLLSTIVLLAATFGIGSIYELFSKKMGIKPGRSITQVLLLTIKSSGFSVVTAFTLFGKEAAIPSAILAVIVLLYLLFLSIRMEIKKR